MVLSNKKLKQKLRTAKAEQLAESESQNNSKNTKHPNTEYPNSETQQSLKSLLDSATQKPRLSKREKRREKSSSLPEGAEVVSRSNTKKEEEGGSEGVNEQKKKKKKRKRDEDLDSGDPENAEVKAQKAKKKKKKKKKKKGKKKAVDEETKKAVESANGGSGEIVGEETVKSSDSQENVDVSTKVYVGGIPYYSTEDDIRSYFESCGTITEVDCMYFPESGKFRGIAIINFKTEAAAKRALAFDGADMGGLFLKIQPYKSTRTSKVSDFNPAIVEGYNRIYVGNLSWDITEEDLRKLFSDFSISSVRFGEDKETKEFKGYAHVDFSDNLSLTRALKLDQKIVCARPVRIRCAVPKKGADTNSKSMQASKEIEAVETSSVSGKIRRRTCYECGEKGHLASSCPKKQAADLVNSATS
ncbi:unnamed protein product [Ilex paraguariensis]|uniref:Protein gar2 n=1 Tax=Ilex paraguariensis TaxID=185542 RepID=A0ABC8U4V2_9AQUA